MTFTVSGCGSFPFRLLSRDKAWPATLDDAEAIEYACPTQAPRQTVRLMTPGREPTYSLWREAGWPVQKIES